MKCKTYWDVLLILQLQKGTRKVLTKMHGDSVAIEKYTLTNLILDG